MTRGTPMMAMLAMAAMAAGAQLVAVDETLPAREPPIKPKRELSIEEQDLLRDAIRTYLARPNNGDMATQANERRRRKILVELSDDLRTCRVSIAA